MRVSAAMKGQGKTAQPAVRPLVKFAAVIKEARRWDRGLTAAARVGSVGSAESGESGVPARVASNTTPTSALAAGVSSRSTHRTAEPNDEPLDNAARTALLLAPPQPPPIAPPTSTSAPMTTIDPRLATELLEKAAFWGDGHRGVARLRFGKTARSGLSGATITLEHDGESIGIRIDDVDDPAVLDRLRTQLAARGVELRES